MPITSKKITQFVYGLINDYGYESYFQLTYADKCEFVAYLIEAAGKDAEQEFLTESPNLDQTIGAFRKCLLPRGSDEYFLTAMKDNAIAYYQDVMHDLFDSALHDTRRIA